MTNQVIDTLCSRFSCRKFLEKPIDTEILEAILKAGTYAPSAKNQQAWHFTVITSQEGKELLLQAAGTEAPDSFRQMFPNGTWPHQSDFCHAPVIILISGRTDGPWPMVGPVLAAGNIMNAAASFGLATLWSTVYTKDLFRDDASRSIRSKLVPDEYEMYAALFLGYPTEVPASRPERRSGVETWI